jgi:Tol biopolymer transport system component
MNTDILRRFRLVVALAAALIGACTAGPPPTPSSTHRATVGPSLRSAPSSGSDIDVSSLTGRILFSAGSAHAEDVYVVNADGSQLRRLTNDPHSDFDPAWSPGGKLIAYRHQDGMDPSAEVYVMNADGSKAHGVSNQHGADWGPTWSPDGTNVLWNCQRDLPYGLRACLAAPDGGGLRVIPADIWVEYPAWSPDGKKIAFMSQEPDASGNDPNYNIFVMNADGTGISRLTDTQGSDGFPAWSPDGGKISFSSTRSDCGNSDAPNCRTSGDIGPFHELWIMNANGSDQHRLSESFGQFSSWSPDGRYLVFSPGLNVIRPDGTGQTSIPVGGVGGDVEFADWGI